MEHTDGARASQLSIPADLPAWFQAHAKDGGDYLMVPRAYIEWTKDVVAALVLKQIVHWSAWRRRQGDPEGWFFKANDEWVEETGIKRHQRERCIAQLRAFGVETEVRQHRGAPTVHYRINLAVFYAVVTAQPPICPKPAEPEREPVADMPQTDTPYAPIQQLDMPRWDKSSYSKAHVQAHQQDGGTSVPPCRADASLPPPDEPRTPSPASRPIRRIAPDHPVFAAIRQECPNASPTGKKTLLLLEYLRGLKRDKAALVVLIAEAAEDWREARPNLRDLGLSPPQLQEAVAALWARRQVVERERAAGRARAAAYGERMRAEEERRRQEIREEIAREMEAGTYEDPGERIRREIAEKREAARLARIAENDRFLRQPFTGQGVVA